jgi:NADH:ubiquinone oxidoreductase subunit 6 (subunit J)
MTILLLIISFFFILFGIFIFTTNKAVYSVLILILNFILASFILFLLNANFFALAYIMIYVGALAILFLFVIMMIDTKEELSSFNKSNVILDFIKKVLLQLTIWGLTVLFLDFFSNILLPTIDYNIFKQNDFYSIINDIFVSTKMTYSYKIEKIKDIMNLIQLENSIFKQRDLFYAELKDIQNAIVSANDIKSLTEAHEKFEKLMEQYPKILQAYIYSLSYNDLFFYYNPQYETIAYFILNLQSSNDKLYFDMVNPILAVGQSLYNSYGALFIIAGIILVIAFIGAINLTLKPKSIFKKSINRAFSKKNSINKF